MHLVRLKIDALPGIDPGFTFEAPSERVNLVTGPNAVGKSSLARALGYLLRGARNDDPQALTLSADFKSGDTRWTVRRNGSEVSWSRDGEPFSRPALPGADQTGLYRLSVENLLASDAEDADLAGELRRNLRGGFDLEEPRIGKSARFAWAEEKALRDARRELSGIDTEYVDLRRQEGKLPGLAAGIEAAKAGEEESRLLQTAVSLQAAVSERTACEQRFVTFPPALEALRGDELERLDSLEQKKQGFAGQTQQQRFKLATAGRALERTGFSRNRPTSAEMGATEKLLRTLATKVVALEAARQSLTRADAVLHDALSQFDGTGEAPKLGSVALKRIEQIAEPLVSARNEIQQLKQRIAWAGEPPAELEIERTRDAVNALKAWLDGDVGEASQAERRRTAGLRCAAWLALLASGFTASMAWLENAIVAMLGAAVAIVSMVAALILEYRQPTATRPTREGAEHNFDETGLAPPPAWTPIAVGEHLHDEIEPRLAGLARRREQASNAEALRMQLGESENKLASLEADCDALAREVGFDPTLPIAAFDRFVRLCVQFDQARVEREKWQAQVDANGREIEDIAGSVTDFLDRWRLQDDPPLNDERFVYVKRPVGFDPKPHGELLRSSFDELGSRLHAADKTRNELDSAATEMRSLQQQSDGVDAEMDALYVRAGLTAGERTSLGRLIEQLKDWNEARRALERARGHEQQLRAQLEEHHDLVQLADQGGAGELRSRLESAERRAREYTALVQEQAEIKAALRKAGRSGKLEQALAAESRAREALANKLDEALLHRATEVLMDDVEQAFHTQHEPEILRRARTLFAEATGHEFSLELDDDSFVARDARQGALKSLGELSSGTRMQLLLALRLARTEAQEQGGETLPLFLDEALTTSDENRFKVMASSLERLAQAENRQIFYLSARLHEAALWREATGTQPPVIDLAAVRFARGNLAPADFRVVQPAPLPQPEGLSSEDYATRLGVPLLDPRLPVGVVHPFHLLRDDLELLHRLMDRWHIVSLGQLEQLLASTSATGAIPDAAMRGRLERRSGVLRTWLDLWRQGRGRPVDRSVLEQSGAVSSKFIAAASDLVDELDGDGWALIKALHNGMLKGFRSSKADELEGWMLAEGFTDASAILTVAGRRRIILQILTPGTEAATADINEVVNWLESSL